jgi:hypothetical protein
VHTYLPSINNTITTVDTIHFELQHTGLFKYVHLLATSWVRMPCFSIRSSFGNRITSVKRWIAETTPPYHLQTISIEHLTTDTRISCWSESWVHFPYPTAIQKPCIILSSSCKYNLQPDWTKSLQGRQNCYNWYGHGHIWPFYMCMHICVMYFVVVVCAGRVTSIWLPTPLLCVVFVYKL